MSGRTWMVGITLAISGAAMAQKTDIDHGGANPALNHSGSMGSSAAMQALSGLANALKSGKKVSLQVNSRLVDEWTPRLMNGQVFVPARFFEQTGQELVYLKQDGRVTIRERSSPQRSIDFDARQKGTDKAMQGMMPQIIGGRMYVPLMPVARTFGMDLRWVPSLNALEVSTDGAAAGKG